MKNEIDRIESLINSHKNIPESQRDEIDTILAKIKSPGLSITEKLFFLEKLFSHPLCCYTKEKEK